MTKSERIWYVVLTSIKLPTVYLFLVQTAGVIDDPNVKSTLGTVGAMAIAFAWQAIHGAYRYSMSAKRKEKDINPRLVKKNEQIKKFIDRCGALYEHFGGSEEKFKNFVDKFK